MKSKSKEEPRDPCGEGRKRVPGFTRKDGRKVAPFCTRVKPEGPSLSGIVKAPIAESQRSLEKLAAAEGCEKLAKNLEFLGNVTSDPELKKAAKARLEWLRSRPSCKIVRKEEKEKK